MDVVGLEEQTIFYPYALHIPNDITFKYHIITLFTRQLQIELVDIRCDDIVHTLP